MLAPNGTFTAAGRFNAVASAGPTPSVFVGGLGFDTGVNLLIDTNAVAANTNRDQGIAQSAAGAIYGSTTVTATDVIVNGMRVSTTGALIYVQANPTQIVNGNPFDANGALCIA